MSSIAKAALISTIIFLGIIASCFFFVPRFKGHQKSATEGAKVVSPEGAVEQVTEPGVKAQLPPVTHEAVKLLVDVEEKGTKRKLARARVMVFRTNEGDRPGQKVWESGKNTSGSFEVSLDPGLYQVHAQCPRFKGEKRNITVVKDTPQSLRFELERGNSISGRVLSANGAPIPNAHVVALRELGSPDADLEELLMGMITIPEMTGEVYSEAVSAEDGTYQLDGLELIYYTIRAVASGYAPGQVEEVPAPREGVDIRLQKGGNIGGIVRDTSGAPVKGATVKAYPQVESQNVFAIIMSKARPPVDKATTEGSGKFLFETLGTGIYNFLIEAKGYQPGTKMKVKVAAGDSQALDLRLDRGLTIAGIVKGPKDEPVSGAKVR